MNAAKSQATPTVSTTLPRLVTRAATSHKTRRRFWRQVLRVFKSYFAKSSSDMNLETWQRLEYRNEYKRPQPEQLHLQKLF